MEPLRATTTPKWELRSAAFDQFLECLDADRNRAGELYETLREKLMLYFQCRAVLAVEDAADEVMNRVIRKVEGGEEIRDPMTYVFGVARMVRLETARQQERQQELPPELPVRPAPPDEEEEVNAQLAWLQRCLAQLTPENRTLITQYYQEEKRSKINLRQALAERLGVDMNALRVRACRIRDQLQACVRKGLSGSSSRR